MAMDGDFRGRGGAGSPPSDPREAEERCIMIALGLRLKELREERDLTQLALAQRSAVAADMISRLENGHYQSPGLRTLLRLADGLGLSVTELLPPEQAAARDGAESSQRLRVMALLRRVVAEDLGMLAEIIEAIVSRSR